MTLYREVKASERLPDDTGLTHPFKSWVHGMAYGVYAYKRHEIEKYLKDYPHHNCIWLEPIEITEEEMIDIIKRQSISSHEFEGDVSYDIPEVGIKDAARIIHKRCG
jgi:hypothetical protein